MKKAIKTEQQKEQQTTRYGLKGIAYRSNDTPIEFTTKSVLQRKEPSLQNKVENKTGLPDTLKTRMESTFGHRLNNVRINTNSSLPAKVGAIATTQGNRIDFAPGHFNPNTSQGQKLIGHEAWHTVQQAQGRVKPTLQMKTRYLVNDSAALEKEADVMGERVVNEHQSFIQKNQNSSPKVNNPIIQRAKEKDSVGIEMQEVNTLQTIIRKLPNLDINKELAAFGEKFGAIVGALKSVKNKETACRTIAIFQYLATHGPTLSNLIAGKFKLLGDDLQKKLAYLNDMELFLSKKLTRGLWLGQGDKGMIAIGARNPSEFFAAGKIALIKKVNEALDSKKSIPALLDDHSQNNDAKTYGRLMQTMKELKLLDIKVKGANTTPPNVGEKIRHDRNGFIYYTTDYKTIKKASELEQNKEYVLRIIGGRSCGIKVKENKDGYLVFSEVEYG